MIVVCVKVGTKYGPEYVNRLASMVARHRMRPYRFLCLTDDPTGLECDYADIETDLPGWWAKLILFKPHSKLDGQRVLYLDLDTVIVANVDFLLDYDGPFCILKDFWGPAYNSSVMSIAPGFGRHVWEQFDTDRMMALHGDQDWITRQVDKADLWQLMAPGKIGSYKADHLEAGPGAFSLVCFHGSPKPADFSHEWVHHAWI